ncbi:MAG: hypothetical protein OXU75_14420 [Deltaproteobacteria bacterium]|nr:hypothetical protein [Deltaproteobacteria bacterium]
MSEDEQRNIAGQLLENLTAARKLLACLEAKRDGLLAEVRKVMPLLQGKEAGKYEEDGRLLRKQKVGLDIDVQVKWPTIDAIGDVLNRINDTQDKVETARDQLKRMGHDI